MIYQPYTTQIHPNLFAGVQHLFRFEGSKYGASVVQASGSYGYNEGLWELAVLEFDVSGEYILTYDTPITDNVIGHLTWEEVQETLGMIDRLED